MIEPTLFELLLRLLLYVLLPLWVIAGFVDYLCHRATGIEHNSGIRETALHAIMGVQVGIPIFLGLTFKINVLVLLICIATLVLHELVAHYDVVYAAPLRKISIWETHAHSYLGTLPFYVIALIVCMNWKAFTALVTLDWAGGMSLELLEKPWGSPLYTLYFFLLMMFLGLVPYAEEAWRCWRVQRSRAPAETRLEP